MVKRLNHHKTQFQTSVALQQYLNKLPENSHNTITMAHTQCNGVNNCGEKKFFLHTRDIQYLRGADCCVCNIWTKDVMWWEEIFIPICQSCQLMEFITLSSLDSIKLSNSQPRS